MLLPHDRLLAHGAEVFVGAREVAAAEESPVDRQRRRVHGFEDQVALRVGDGAFLLGVAAPEHVDDALYALGDGAHHGVGEGLPAFVLVGACLMGPHGQRGVE